MNSVRELEGLLEDAGRFLWDLSTNWDCDEGAHGTHSPHCRVCKAKKLLDQYPANLREKLPPAPPIYEHDSNN